MALSDREKIEYAKKALRRQYAGADQTSGQLIAGKFYLIAAFITGDDFANVGAKLNQAGQIFKAIGTTPTVWTNSSTLNEIRLADLKAQANAVFGCATDTITLTSGAFEGGSQSGQITFEKVLLGKALEELIEEWDPGWSPPTQVGGGLVMQLSM